MLHPPGPYAAWVSWLDAYGRGEDLPSGHLAQIDARIGPQMFGRLLSQVDKAFFLRQKRWTEALNRDVRGLSGNSVDGVGAVATTLRSARQRLAPLLAFTEHPALTDELRTTLREALVKTVKSAQQTLEESTRQAPVELRSVVRGNSMVLAMSPPPPPVHQSQAPPRGRRVIL